MEKILEQLKDIKLDGKGIESMMGKIGELCDKVGLHDQQVGKSVKKTFKRVKKMIKEGKKDMRHSMEPLLKLANVDPELVKLVEEYQKLIEGGVTDLSMLDRMKDIITKFGIDSSCFDLLKACTMVSEQQISSGAWNEQTDPETIKQYLMRIAEDPQDKVELRYHVTLEVLRDKQVAISQWETIMALLEKMCPKSNIGALELFKISIKMVSEDVVTVGA